MAKLKYKDKDGFWQELPVGTNVVANPMLTGTEQELTSLQVGNAKYKSGGGKLYKHHIAFDVTYTAEGYQSIDGRIFIDIYSSSSTAITLDTIPQLESGNAYIAWLYNPGYGTLGVVGVIFNPTRTNNTIDKQIEVLGAGTSTMEQFQSLYYLFPYNAVTSFVDTCTEI